MKTSTFQYVTYISSTAEKVWDALTKTQHTEQYFFGTAIQSDWQVGSRIEYSRGEVTDSGEILSYEPHRKMTYTWESVGDDTQRELPTIVTFELKELGKDVVKLTLKHENLLDADYVEEADTFRGVHNGWPFIISNLKSYLETDKTMVVSI
ncbi:MAG: SRPBCC family protein [Melioribacteraceae bacterium]|nr:SRPBCC family protein [Melioribacteraceae bacterium]